MLSVTWVTPGVRHADCRAVSRSDQLCTEPDKVTLEPCTSTAIFFASLAALRFSASSISDFTAACEMVGLIPDLVADACDAQQITDGVFSGAALVFPFDLDQQPDHSATDFHANSYSVH